MIHILFRWALLFNVLFVFACSDSVKHLKKTSTVLQPENVIPDLLNNNNLIAGEGLYSVCALSELYFTRHYNPMWFKKDELTPQGDSLLRILHQANYYGLVREDYHLNVIDQLSEVQIRKPVDAKVLASLDILMTDGLLAVANHLHYGRVDKDHLTLKSSGIEPDSAIWNVVSNAINKNYLTRGLEKLEPQYASYRSLKNDLKIKLDSLPLVLTDSAASLRLINRIRNLSINMEQWRWESPDFHKPYVLVNIPSYQLGVIDHDSMVFESNVVVGTSYSQTPTLDAKLVNLVLYPFWNVPRDIATKELLPKIKHDSTYLLSNHYRVLDITGKEIDPDSIKWRNHNTNNFPFMIQQSEGEHNALGIVKFNFVNDFNVYLHDTNAKRFFGYNKRSFSHGCIRVERALDLAKFLVNRENPYCSVKDYHRFLKEGKQQQLNFDPIELRIRYFTCQAGEDGIVRFFDDVYGKNAPLMEAFFCREDVDECQGI